MEFFIDIMVVVSFVVSASLLFCNANASIIRRVTKPTVNSVRENNWRRRDWRFRMVSSLVGFVWVLSSLVGGNKDRN